MPSSTYDIDPAHSGAHFSVRHMMIANVRGEFTKVSGAVTFNPENPAESHVEATIEAASLRTGDEQRDAHLKSADFFDVAQFPTLHFVSRSVEAVGQDEYMVKGDLTIHGVTREVALRVDGPTAEMKDPWGNIKAGAEAKTKIHRKEFGLNWNAALEAGGVLVGEEVTITLEVELTRRAA